MPLTPAAAEHALKRLWLLVSEIAADDGPSHLRVRLDALPAAKPNSLLPTGQTHPSTPTRTTRTPCADTSPTW